ncbi:MAG: C-GCAxxG-C-C family protein [Clostridia bacterium]|nr:C-GCAxxG-C-C family protein [Clostridia bacterium]
MLDHAKLAHEHFLSGCNCAQAVVYAFSDLTGFDRDTSLKLACSFGGGFGRLREVCGAFSGAVMIAGLLWGYSDTETKQLKADHYALIQKMAAEFRDMHGSIVCREILRGIESSTDSNPSDRTAEYYKKRPCPKIAASAAAIVDKILAERGFEPPAGTHIYPLDASPEHRFVVIFTRHNGKWIYARAKGRDVWETAGGHIEPGETALDAAKRELWEETGAVDYDIRPVFDYSVNNGGGHYAFGQVFLADVRQFGDLPAAFEMEEIRGFDTYPAEMRFPGILPVLYERMKDEIIRRQG